MQSIRRRSPLASWSGVTPSAKYSRTLPLRSLSRTYGITCRLSSVVMYSISFATFMCQWMPVATPSRSLPPPTCTSSVVTDSVFGSSSAYS